MNDRDPAPKPGEAVAQLVDSALKLSSSVAQAVAEATTGKPQESRAGEPHLQAIIRHGTTAAGSLISTIVRTVREQPGGRPSAETGPARAPRVRAGGTLRIPLSIDNPGATAMEGIVPRRVTPTGREADIDMRFTPETMTIAPSDFEKLVVLLSVPADLPPGRYAPSFTLSGQKQVPITLAIEVVAQEDPVSPPAP